MYVKESTKLCDKSLEFKAQFEKPITCEGLLGGALIKLHISATDHNFKYGPSGEFWERTACFWYSKRFTPTGIFASIIEDTIINRLNKENFPLLRL